MYGYSFYTTRATDPRYHRPPAVDCGRPHPHPFCVCKKCVAAILKLARSRTRGGAK